MDNAFFAFCSTKSTVVPPAEISRIMWKISSTRIGESPMDGSSIRMIFGFDISARPMASICCSPPLKVPASWFLRSSSRGKLSYTFANDSAISCLSFLVYAPSFKFSYTDNSANTRRPSGTCAIPMETILCPGIFEISHPSKMISPAAGLNIPVIVCNVVVFPAPFAPISAMTSPSLTSKEIPLIAWITP